MRILPRPLARISTFAVAALYAHGSWGAELQCYENPKSNAMQCVAPTQVREKDGIRSAPLYGGGPNRIRDTGFTIHVNCKTGVTHLKDRDGVSFAGGDGHETPALRQLRSIVCETKLTKQKK